MGHEWRRNSRGFTLVELMIVVAIIGILAGLASYGVTRYAAHARSAEALVNLGGIGRAVQAAAGRETMAAALLAANEVSTDAASANNGNGSGSSGKGKGNSGNNNGNGATVTKSIPGMCMTADPVPSSMSKVTGGNYQPNPAPGSDYNTGDRITGWRCLQFSISSPHFYQYRYDAGGPPVNVTLPHGGTPPGLDKAHTWAASAQGDLDGDGKTSWFVLNGYITDRKEIIWATAIDSEDPEE